MAIKILIGGSPCTHWSIAQKNNRETTAEGIGWELFKNYLIAKEKFKPDLFLYENNKSAAQAIKDQIAFELGVGTDPKARFTYINSALVSAQNRQRFYVTNFGDIEQPEDRGILLKDILENGSGFGENNDKSYALCATYYNGQAPEKVLKYHERTHVAEPVNITADGKSQCLRATCYKDGIRNLAANDVDKKTCVAEPVCVAERGRYENGVIQQHFEAREDGKTNTLTRVFKDNNVAEPVCLRYERTEEAKRVRKQYEAGEVHHGFNELRTLQPRLDGKSNTLLTVLKDNPICEPVGFSMTGEWDKNGIPTKAVSCADGKTYTVYEVKDGQISIKGKHYLIKLADGYYIIRKLTVTECCRLQTMPDDYCKAVSATQGYKGLGNGWTAEVIIHLLNHALKDAPRNEEIVVLSLYDGIGTGRYCLEKMGFTNVTYHAYEIDKYPIQIAMDNYPDIIQHGDAFDVREDDWQPPQTHSEWLDDLLSGGDE